MQLLPYRLTSIALCLGLMLALTPSAALASQDNRAVEEDAVQQDSSSNTPQTEAGKPDADSAESADSESTNADPNGAAPSSPGEGAADAEDSGWMKKVDKVFGDYLVTPLETVLFWDFWTSRFIKVDGAWSAENVSLSRDENGVRVTYPGADGSVQRVRAASLEELQSVDPQAYALFNQYAKDENRNSVKIPLVVAWLLGGAIFFTLRMGFINIRGFWHSIRLVKGDFDDPSDVGEVSHFQALSAALSATVGLGNIAGVALAIGAGGPGATFWMIVIGLLGMSTKFAECTLGQMYRHVDKDGTVSGGPMYYLKEGLAEMGLGPLGWLLSLLFTLLCLGASFGGGNAFQVGQSLTAVRQEIAILQDMPWIYGLVMAVLVGVVIIGGIKAIGAVAGRIVPVMCFAYVAAALFILATNADKLGAAVGSIFASAFNPSAMYGGVLGVMVIGIQRAVFSNEAGAGSAAIAHSAAKTDEPISEGIVALLEPFIDTVVVCTMTALVIIVTGVYDNPAYADLVAGKQGAALTAAAFSEGGAEWFKWILYAAVVLFAYSTLISWSYYGERCFTRLFGNRSSLAYKLIFLVFTFLGSIVTQGKVLEFSDLLILGMAFPNVLGVIILSGKVKARLTDYWSRYKSGELKPH